METNGDWKLLRDSRNLGKVREYKVKATTVDARSISSNPPPPFGLAPKNLAFYINGTKSESGQISIAVLGENHASIEPQEYAWQLLESSSNRFAPS